MQERRLDLLMNISSTSGIVLRITLILLSCIFIISDFRPEPHFGFIIAFITMFWLPGDSLYRIFKIADLGKWESLPVKFLFSIFLIVLTGIPAFLYSMNIYVFLLIHLSVSSFVFAGSLLAAPYKYEKSLEKETFFKITAFLICLLSVMSVFLAKPDVSVDVLLAAAEIRISENNPIIQTWTGYKNLFNYPGYNYNIHDLSFASVAVIGHLDAFHVIMLAPAALSIFMFLSCFSFTRILTGSETPAYISVIMFAIILGTMESFHCFRTSSFYLVLTGFIFVPIGYSFIIKFLNCGELRNLLVIAIAALVTASFHPFGFISLFSGLLFFFFWFLLKPKTNKTLLRKIILMTIICLITASPHIILQLKDFELNNVTEAGFKPWRVLKFSDELFLMNPEILFAPHYHVTPPFTPRLIYAFLFIAGLVFFKYLYKENWAVYVIALSFTPLLIVFNPLIYPLAGKAMSFQLARRFTQIPPICIIAGLLIWLLIRNKSNFIKKSVSACLFCFFALNLLFVFNSRKNIDLNLGLSVYKMNFEKNPYLPEMMNNPENKMELIKILRAESKQSVVACDYDIGALIIGFTPHTLVSMHPQYISPAVKDEDERLKALDVIFNSSDEAETIKAINRFEIDYIVLNSEAFGDFGGNSRLEKFLKNPDMYINIDLEISEGLNLFKVVHHQS